MWLAVTCLALPPARPAHAPGAATIVAPRTAAAAITRDLTCKLSIVSPPARKLVGVVGGWSIGRAGDISPSRLGIPCKGSNDDNRPRVVYAESSSSWRHRTRGRSSLKREVGSPLCRHGRRDP